MKSIFHFLSVSVFVSTLSLLGFAQDTSGKAEFGLPAQSMPFKEYEQQGQLITLKIIPAGKETRLYIVGKEAANVSVDKYAVHARMTMGRHRKDIEFKREKDYFSTEEKLKGELLQLKLEEIESKRIEEFRIKLKKP